MYFNKINSNLVRNIKFCKEFNEQTKENIGLINSVIIKIYPNKTYSFIVKNPPTSILLKQIIGLKITKKPGSGSKNPGKVIIGKISTIQLKDVAIKKQSDLNAYSIENSIKIISGTAKSMGIEIE